MCYRRSLMSIFDERIISGPTIFQHESSPDGWDMQFWECLLHIE